MLRSCRKFRFLMCCLLGASAPIAAQEPEWLRGRELKPTYAEGAGLIVEHRCVHCHRPGEIAPMSFPTFNEFRRWSRDTHTPMNALIRERAMPPWPADPAIGAFRNREFMTQAEMDLLIAWIDAKLPRGTGEFVMQTQWVEGWNIGQPDVVFELPAHTLAEDSTGEFATFRVKTEFAEDRWIVAAEARPQDASIVAAIDAGPLGAYQPGNSAVTYAPGLARRLPAGAEIEVRMHYRKDAGYAATEQSRLGVVFAKDAAAAFDEVHVDVVETAPFTVPKGVAKFEQSVTFSMPGDGRLVALMPVLQERGASVRYDAKFPDGRTETLLSIPAWDARWKYRYEFAEPIAAPKGTAVKVNAVYDNSAENLKNPDPWSDAVPGPRGETLQGWVSYVLD